MPKRHLGVEGNSVPYLMWSIAMFRPLTGQAVVGLWSVCVWVPGLRKAENGDA